MSEISKLAVVDPSARIGAKVRIGPFCVIGPDVVLGDGCELFSNVVIEGHTRIGERNVFYQNVVVGVTPQDLKYEGAPTETIIGDDNVFRENCSVHRGTELGGGRTIIGSHNLFMVGVHIAHDCELEDRILIGNQTQLAGHVLIEEGAVVSALIGLHNFVSVGKYSYVAGLTPVRRDVPPFMKFSGDPNEVRGVNEEGLKRNGFGREDILEIKRAYRKLYRKDCNSIVASIEDLQGRDGLNVNVRYLCRFLQQSCGSRFGRYRETQRQDANEDRMRCDPFEVRAKQK